MDQWLPLLQDWLYEQPSLHGCLTVKMRISVSGQVTGLDFQTDTVRQVQTNPDIEMKRNLFWNFVRKSLLNLKFPKSSKTSQVVIPLLFK